MNAQTKVTTLAEAMADAFAEFEAATKAANNPHFKSKYAALPDVIDAIKPALIAHRLFFTQNTHEMEGGVCVETQVHHESGESMSFGKLFVPASKRDAHGYGSALTYARRYSLMTAFGVPADDDDGNAAVKTVANDPAPRANGNKDKPFPQGPAKNRTELKTLGRAFWRDVEGCGDADQLDILLDTNRELISQLKVDLPAWLTGWEKDGEQFEGLDAVIERKRTEFANEAWKRNPVSGG